MKICSKCKIEKSLSEFRLRGKTYQGWCKPCAKEYDKGWHKVNKEKRNKDKLLRRSERALTIRQKLDDLKKGPCKDCGRSYIPFAMDFDHLEDKFKDISCMRTGCYSFKTILKEVAKCDLLCATCHRIRTYNRNNRV